MKLIDKDALVAELKRQRNVYIGEPNKYKVLSRILSFIDTLEVKEVGISIPNIDDTLKEEGLDPDYSKEAKIFKETYYMALEKT